MAYKSPLHEMSETTPTQFWNDNCSPEDIAYAMSHGAVGATTNPVIVGQVLSKDLNKYAPLIKQLVTNNPTATEDEIAWLLNEHMALEGAKQLQPVFEQTGGKAGYISIQTNTKYFNNAQKTTEQAIHFSKLAKNMMVKMPATKAGIQAVEESTYHGVNVNATVSFSVPQAIAVAEAIERGMERRKKEGLDNSHLHPVCTIMIGRVDDWLKEIQEKENIIVDPHAINMSGIAVFKNAHKIYQEKGYHTRLLAAAYRHHHHWSELIGADMIHTIPANWLKRFAESKITIKNRMANDIDPGLLAQLQDNFADFNKAYNANGMTHDEFDTFGATVRTLNQFLDGYDKMVTIVRSFMVYNK